MRSYDPGFKRSSINRDATEINRDATEINRDATEINRGSTGSYTQQGGGITCPPDRVARPYSMIAGASAYDHHMPLPIDAACRTPTRDLNALRKLR